ncbi:MAG TPA: lactoylglutathione lyase [Eggerthellaceae bacterium]|nr:lactoylglutathione lyase [Eggerthellaceae bacterium]
MKVHHIGYAVADIDKAKAAFSRMGYDCGPTIDDDLRKVRIVILRNGNERVELVAPNGNGNPVEGVLGKMGATPYHICYEVEDLEAAISELQSIRGWMLTKPPAPAPAIEGRRVAFMYQKDVGTFELVETDPADGEEK